ncbi:IclR family transcriptional regulator [Jeotgalibaca ciconiae]|uniref:IclR family transcriptional regulator n=1 Tax=Jeotgalibaca ciconiae TaxID=2496265 RepID=A0A3Q9BL16_9LACT|nr:IclR family transcriptional regulator [Jeotgalibaca ciconiae]AZP04728.1 IclR family transcriptional regulator [Jeotgalibaca ciconiae]HJB23921.1 IclR family transcriptional regulator [Candidatus Jeotgalibaca pullicola]
MLKTVDLTLQVLMKFTNENNSWTGKKLASVMDQNYATIYRILKTLHKRDFLTYNSVSKEYSLGIVLWQLGQTMYESLNLEELVRPSLIQLKEETDESVFFTVRRGNKGITLMAEEPAHKVKFSAEIGSSVPLFPGASYRAILAFQSEEFIADLIEEGLPQYTPQTMTSPAALRKELEMIRKEGYARSEGEYTPDVVALAVPIRDYENKVNCSVTLSGPSYRLQKTDQSKAILLLKETALNIEKILRNTSYKIG